MAARLSARLRTKALIALLAAALGVLTLAVVIVVDRRAVEANASEVQRLVRLSVRTGELLHETQRERGRTVQMLSSKGTAERRVLDDQRRATDARAAQFRQFVATAPVDGGIRDAVLAALEDLRGLETLRAAADDPATPPLEMVRQYTILNSHLLEIVSRTATTGRDAEIALQLQAYLAFLDAKERSGLERAQLVNALSNDAFAPGQFVLATSLAASQETLFTTFERTATPALRQAWLEAQRDASFADVTAMRDTVRARAATGGFGIDPAQWFDRSTARIDMLKHVLNLQARELATTADDLAADARRGVLLSILLATVLLVVVCAASTAYLNSEIARLSRQAGLPVATGERGQAPGRADDLTAALAGRAQSDPVA